MPRMMLSIEVQPADLTVSGWLHDRTKSEDYYKRYKGGRTDIWLSQVEYKGRHVANVFYETNGAATLNLSPTTEANPALQAEIMRMARQYFNENCPVAERTRQADFLAEMKRKHGIFWQP